MNESRHPTLSVGLLVKVFPGGQTTVDRPATFVPLGSCFPFRRATCFLTAAHCVHGMEASEVGVVGLFLRTPRPAMRIVRHPSADLALIEFDPLPGPHADLVSPFRDFDPQHPIGTDVEVFGYPIDTLGERPGFPTVRMLKGHVQRLIEYQGIGRYQYPAAELSILPTPGLSGGPVYSNRRNDMVIGLITESIQSTVRSETIEEIIESDKHYRTIYREITSFGVGLLLDRAAPWLDQHVPV